MNKKLLRLGTISLIGLVVSSLALASCAPAVVAEGQLKPTQSLTATEPPYPGPTLATPELLPTPVPNPTRQPGGWWSVTPLPGESVRVGEITQTTPPTAPRYSVRQELRETKAGYAVMALFVRDSVSRTEVRLGDDSDYAKFQAMSDDYVIWNRGCVLCQEPQPAFAPGLYAYVLVNGKQIFIGEGGTTEISGSWVAYLSVKGGAEHPGLYAHNIITGEDIPLAQALPNFRGRFTRDLFAINENKVAWVDLEPATNEISLGVYDLDRHTSQKLNTPPLTEPLFVSVSNEVVTWRDGYWKGYLLNANALFTIPVIPPGWEAVPIYDDKPVTAQGNHLYWAFQVDDEFYYFTAPIVPKGSEAQPTHVVPTPQRKLTVSPVAITPTPIPLPTAYP